MSKFGLKIAKLFGKKLPAYESQEDAKKSWLSFKDTRLQKLIQLSKSTDVFDMDYTPESLKKLELWYFHLWERDEFSKLNTTIVDFEECMAVYFGEVSVRNVSSAQWIVQEFAFENGKYEIGIKSDLLSIMRSRLTDHYKTPNNKRIQSIWREYNKYFS